MISYEVPIDPQSGRSRQGKKNNCVLVLGMHRSGTSALTRVLNLHGVDLGRSLLAADTGNERGFWEHVQLMLLNDQVMQAIGRPTADFRRLPDGCWDWPIVKRLEEEIVAVLQRDFSAKSTWGAKDPRLCRLLPLWQGVIAKLGVQIKYVIPVRSPYEVAESLQRRDNLPRICGLVLWLRYVLEAERHSRGASRAFTTYDHLLADWRGTVSNIVARTGLSLPVSSEDAAAEVEAFLSPSLRHHQDVVLEGVPDGLQRMLEQVYGTLSQAAISATEPDPGVLDKVSAELDVMEALFAGPERMPSSSVAGQVSQAGVNSVVPLTLDPEGNGLVPLIPMDAGTASNVPQRSDGSSRETHILDYSEWTKIHGLRESDAELMAERMVKKWRNRPSVHLIAPVKAGEAKLLGHTLQSVSEQLYPGWGLTVVAEYPCPNAAFNELPNLEWRQADGELVVELNRAAVDTDADWVGLIRPGDRLAPHALFSFLDHLEQSPQWTMIYSDEDRMDTDARRSDPWFKSDPDLDLLRSQDCIGGFSLVRRGFLLKTGGYGEHVGVETFELALKAMESDARQHIGHIAEILYHRGPITQALYDQATLAHHRRSALEAHLERCGDVAEVTDGLVAGGLRVSYGTDAKPTVSVIVAVRDDLQMLESCIDSLREVTDYPGLELLLVDEGSEAEDTYDYLEDLQKHDGVRWLTSPMSESRAASYNAAAKAAQGEFLVFLDRRALFVQENWLQDLLGHAQRPGVAVVAPRIVGSEETIVHSALILGLEGIAGDAFAGRSVWDGGYSGRALADQGVSAVPNACLMVRREVFDEVGGFDENSLPNVWYHLDFCLRLSERGLRVVWTPQVLLGWQPLPVHESTQQQPEKEEAVVLERWLEQISVDPCYNRNLSLSHQDFRPDEGTTVSWDVSFHERPRVLGVPADILGCGEYRVLAPLKALDDAVLARCGVTAPQENFRGLPSVVELARLAPDTLLLQAALDDVHLEAMARYKRFNKAFRVFDMEDLKSMIPEKNGRRKFVFRDIKARTRKALNLCDRLITTTEPLAEAYKGLIDDIRVVPNYLAGSRWGGLQSMRRQGPKPRVGWAGAQQHQGDLELLIPVVEATADEVDWVFFGMCPDALRPFVREVHEFVEYANYPRRLAGLNLDLAVAPLEDHPFNVAKSNLRLLEYGVLGWPVVCTDIEPYRNAPVQRVANDPSAWIGAIRERIHDLDATALEGDRLKSWVTSGWMLEDHLDEWLTALLPDSGSGTETVFMEAANSSR